MAKRKPDLPDEEVLLDEENKDEAPIEDSELPSRIAEIKSAYSDNKHSVMVRFLPIGGREEKRLPEQYPVETFEAERIAQEYGGGKYYFTVIDEKGRIVTRFKTDFAEKKKPDITQIFTQQKKEESTEKLIEFMGNELSANRKEMQNLQQQNLALMLQIVQAMNRPAIPTQPQTNTFEEVMKVMGLMKQFAPEQSKQMDWKEMFMLVRELREEAGSAAEGGDGLSLAEKIIMKFVDGLSPKVTGMMGQMFAGGLKPNPTAPQNQILPQQQIPAVPPVTVQQQAQPQPIQENLPLMENKDDQVLKFVRQNLFLLKMQAQNDSSVSSVADVICKAMKEEQFEVLQDYLKNDGLTKIILAFPEVNLYKNWFAALADEIVNYYEVGEAAELENAESLEETEQALETTPSEETQQ